MSNRSKRKRIHVEGVVQGVGFRPYVYRLARSFGLTGFVRNDVVGVDIEVEGVNEAIEGFLCELPRRLPGMAHIARTSVVPLTPLNRADDFSIHQSGGRGEQRVAITPDAHVCDDCLRELFDPLDRRYKYPFLNCTNCGPRFTIVTGVPYDRPNTTMASFEMCAECRGEYENPDDRRFHAQPVACPACGPKLELRDSTGTAVESTDIIEESRQRLLAGEILAIKGLGGFHLAVDATNEESVARLRQRKGREKGKPFAVMTRDLEQARHLAHINETAEVALTSTPRPIVLLDKQKDTPLAEAVAPSLGSIGIMLPYTPLHHLLLATPMPPLVMTSGNPSEEPITKDNDEALRRLNVLCDAFLVHNRPIQSSCDDSVLQIIDCRCQMIRRARGYTPRPFNVSSTPTEPGIVALGGEMKSALCFTRPGQLIMGRHLGELSNRATQESLRQELDQMTEILGFEPKCVAHDLHPDYFTTRFAAELRRSRGLELLAVQHHHAHLASCLAENDHRSDDIVLGIIFDGTGYGTDDTIWGSELLIGSYGGFERAAWFRPIALPGGDTAIRSPWRTAFALLHDTLGEETFELDLPWLNSRPERLLRDLSRMLEASLGCPQSGGMGRLFDAVAVIVGVPATLEETIGYEAQAALELEGLAQRCWGDEEARRPYFQGAPRADHLGEIDTRPLIREIVECVRRGLDAAWVAAKFHATIADLTAEIAHGIAQKQGIHTIALSGGCFHNRLLASRLSRSLEERGYQVLRQKRVPCGDGGLALGQAAVASTMTREAR